MLIYTQIFLSLVFLISGTIKVLEYSNFKTTISKIGFKNKYLTLVSSGVVFIELLISGLILFNQTRLLASLIITILTSVFFYLSIKMIINGKSIDCNCFGSISEEKLGFNTIIKSLILFILCIIQFINKEPSGIEIASYRTILDAISSSIGIMCIYLLLVSYNNLSSKLK
ncbi:MauE/DoxX family redox-associated membrane protein [Robertmurraya korlensis]|uniref:MauE/DoxX family redox-associated membrane protein n=1 Tax=Robertmurraya korlensis TaxID=519977 RepID=UPI0035290492